MAGFRGRAQKIRRLKLFFPHKQWLHADVDPRNFTLLQLSMCAVFFIGWTHQFRAMKILAGLRSNNRSSNKYSIPEGDWFDLVSCPHYLAEVIMYASLSLILGLSHRTGIVLAMWVFINQTVAALMSHYWYQDKFEDYPPKRKAIFPMVL